MVTVNSTLASYPGTKAVDGIALQDSTESFYNSAGSGTNEFWQVDLGAEYIIQNITFFNRFFNACCRFRAATGQYLFAMNATRGTVGPVFNLTAAAVQTYNYTGACAVTPTPSALPSPGGCGARYLRVAMVYPGVDLINFDELEAWTADGRNVALRAPATSFSCYSGSCTTYGPACVTDGLRGDKPCFFNSAGTSASEWVEVDLRASYILSRVIFYNRQSCCWNRANNTQLRVLDSNRVQLAAFNLTTATAPQSFNMPWAFCPTQTASGSASLSASGSRSASRSASPSVSAVATGSRTGTGTTTGTATGTATRSLTPGASASTTALGTGTATVTASTTATTSVTATLTGTETGSLTSSATATATLVTASPTTTATATLTRGVSASLSAAATATLSPGAAASISSTVRQGGVMLC